MKNELREQILKEDTKKKQKQRAKRLLFPVRKDPEWNYYTNKDINKITLKGYENILWLYFIPFYIIEDLITLPRTLYRLANNHYNLKWSIAMKLKQSINSVMETYPVFTLFFIVIFVSSVVNYFTLYYSVGDDNNTATPPIQKEVVPPNIKTLKNYLESPDETNLTVTYPTKKEIKDELPPTPPVATVPKAKDITPLVANLVKIQPEPVPKAIPEPKPKHIIKPKAEKAPVKVVKSKAVTHTHKDKITRERRRQRQLDNIEFIRQVQKAYSIKRIKEIRAYFKHKRK